MKDEIYQPFMPHTEQVPFTEQLLCNSCLHRDEVKTRIYSTKCSVSLHTHIKELTVGLADTRLYLNTANTLPADSWKFEAAGSQTLCTHVACDKKPHFCIYASVYQCD